jgi:hypothetical protein
MLSFFSIFVKISMRMILVSKKKFMVFFFCQILMEQLGQLLDQIHNFISLQARNQGIQQVILGEQAEKKSKRLLVQFPVKAETDLLKGDFFFRHPTITFQFTLRLLGPSYSQKKMRCQVPNWSLPSAMMTVRELPVNVAIMWEGELPSAWR